MKTKTTISKRQLQKYINELIALAKTVASDVETIIHIPGDEGQHAWLEIYAPDELVDQIGDLVSERAHNIFMEQSYDIGTIVFEKSELLHAATEVNEDGYNGRQ
jgi:hypothetical protein